MSREVIEAIVVLLRRKMSEHRTTYERIETGIVAARHMHLLLTSNHPDPEKWRQNHGIAVLATIDEMKEALNELRAEPKETTK